MKNELYKQIQHHYDSKVTTGDKDLNLRITDGRIVHHHEGWVTINELRHAKKKSNDQAWLENFIYQKETELVSTLAASLSPSLTESSKVYDAGCGRGGSALILNSEYSCKIIGVSLSKKQVKFANETAKHTGQDTDIEFLQRDMINSKQDSKKFDIIWVLGSAEYVADLNYMSKEFYRLAKPGAQIIIYTWTKNSRHAKSQEFVNKVDDWYKTILHDLIEFVSALKMEGWKNIHTEEHTDEGAKYWQVRSMLRNGSGSEKFMDPGFSCGALNYHLITAKKD